MGRLHDEAGRFLPRFCPDRNCNGETVLDREPRWIGGPEWPIARCDGLTHGDDNGELVACERSHSIAHKVRAHLLNQGKDNG